MAIKGYISKNSNCSLWWKSPKSKFVLAFWFVSCRNYYQVLLLLTWVNSDLGMDKNTHIIYTCPNFNDSQTETPLNIPACNYVTMPKFQGWMDGCLSWPQWWITWNSSRCPTGILSTQKAFVAIKLHRHSWKVRPFLLYMIVQWIHLNG